MDHTTSSPAALWALIFDRVRHAVASPMVWLAMQAAEPIVIDGNYFVVGLPKDKQYLVPNLQTFEAVSAIEDSLRHVSGRILAFRLIEGSTVAEWQAVHQAETAAVAVQSAEVPQSQSNTSSPLPVHFQEPHRDVCTSWDKLNERLTQLYKAAPLIKYPHGQARLVLEAVKHISDTIDLLLPASGEPIDEAQERFLSRTLERFSGIINLDPIFLSLELFRYRQSQGK